MLLIFLVCFILLLGLVLFIVFYSPQKDPFHQIFNPFSEYRFQYYTRSSCFLPTTTTFRKTIVLQSKPHLYSHKPSSLFFIHDKIQQKEFPSYWNGYYDDIYPYLTSTLPVHKTVSVFFGDIREECLFPTLVKTRPVHLDSIFGSVLFPLQMSYHFKPSPIPSHPPRFLTKKSQIIWRGASTGLGFSTPDSASEHPAHRSYFLQMVSGKHPHILDAGLSVLTDNAHPHYSRYVKGSLSRENILEYKYVLSIEGHDVAGNLKWLLDSDSVVFMTSPNVVSWFMEDHLQPYVHFIPLQDDFSDLESQFIWAERNPSKCLEIIQNANAFIRQFYDPTLEKQIASRVMQWFKNSFTFVDE